MVTQPLSRHADHFDLGMIGKVATNYRPTFPIGGTLIDDNHRELASRELNGPLITTKIPGWLQRADALKLYEMAYFSRTVILELGTYRGLSSSIMATARRASGRADMIETVDIDPAAADEARKNLAAAGVANLVNCHARPASELCQQIFDSGIRPDFCFIDHSHSYEDTFEACEWMKKLIAPGGFILFHDFVDARNNASVGVGQRDDVYGIVHACATSFADGSFVFWGAYGCTGLYRAATNSG